MVCRGCRIGFGIIILGKFWAANSPLSLDLISSEFLCDSISYLQVITMTSGGDNSRIDLKAFVEAVQGEFRRLNARFDDLASPSKSKGKGLVGEEEDG